MKYTLLSAVLDWEQKRLGVKCPYETTYRNKGENLLIDAVFERWKKTAYLC